MVIIQKSYPVSFAPSTAFHALLGKVDGRPWARPLSSAVVQQNPKTRLWASILSTRMSNVDSDNDGPDRQCLRTAVLIQGRRGGKDTSAEGIADVLSFQGFAIRLVEEEDFVEAIQAAAGQSKAETTTTAVPRSSVIFDLSGRVGRDVALSCESAGMASLYSFTASTGMFQKIFGAEESPTWIDPLVGSSYEQILNTRGWGFLAEDESEPRFAFDLTETGPWERAREERAQGDRDDPRVSPLGYCIKRMTDEEVERAAEALTPSQFHVLLEGGTDAPDAPPTPQQHSSEKTPEVTNGASVAEDSTDSTRFWGRNEKSGKGEEKSGVFVSALGGLPLFLPEDELKSVDSTRRLGWPGFRRPAHPDHVVLREESGPLRRTEVLCARSGAHLGHVFDDGPPPGGQRYCINRSSLVFLSLEDLLPRESRPIHRPSAVTLGELGSLGEALKCIKLQEATFAGGCFWHVRDDFSITPGVHEVSCGYCGRIEAVRVLFDPLVTTYSSLAKRFFYMHDPTTGDRQGNDWGPQYQAALFPHDEDQRRFAEEAMVWAREKLPLLGGRENIRPRSETKEKLGRSVSGDNACLPNAPAWGVAAGAAINSDSGGLEKRRKKAYGRQSLGVQGTGEGGEKNSPPGTIEALPTWWEGSDIKTLVLPLPEEGFQPEVLRKSSGQA